MESLNFDEKNTVEFHPNHNRRFVAALTFLACIGGFLFGYDTGVISGAMLFIKTEFALSTIWQELIVSITVGAAAIFALCGGVLTDVFGRKLIVIAASVFFTIGSLVMGVAHIKLVVAIGRFIVGIGIGLASMSVPLYLAEVAPAHIRGRLVVTNNIFITGGQFIAAILDAAFGHVHEGIAAIPAIIQLCGFLFMPESPRWLIAKGKRDAARKVLERIYPNSSIGDREFSHIERACEHDRKEKAKGGQNTLTSIMRTPPVRRALAIGCALQLFQQTVGINTVMYYSATIIEMSGVKDPIDVLWLASIVAAMNFLFTFVGLYLVDRQGRRLLTLVSLLGVAIILAALGITFHFMSVNSVPITHQLNNPIPGEDSSYCLNAQSCDSCISLHNCGFCFYDNLPETNFNGTCLPANPDLYQVSLYGPCNDSLHHDNALTWAHNWCPIGYSWLIVAGLAIYLIFFAPGMGPMPWTINSEIYPLWARGTCVSIATAVNWTANLVVSMTFLTLMEVITKQGTYYLYSAVALIGFVFFYTQLPETKGKSLEEIESLFQRPWTCSPMRSQSPRRFQDDEYVTLLHEAPATL